jgi:hypothetical protein
MRKVLYPAMDRRGGVNPALQKWFDPRPSNHYGCNFTFASSGQLAP